MNISRTGQHEPITICLYQVPTNSEGGTVGQQPLVTFELVDEQNKFCSSNSKWALDNPGECTINSLVIKNFFEHALTIRGDIMFRYHSGWLFTGSI